MIQIHAGGPRRPEVHVLGDFATQAAQMLADAIVRTVREKGRCRLGLAGGTTPAPVYSQLRKLLPKDIYPQLLITWTDERVLPHVGQKPGDWEPFDPQSSLRTAYSEWLAHVEIPVDNILPLSLSDDPRAELLRFGTAFRDRFDAGLDVALVGLGADGHVASLFPDHPALDVTDIALAIHDAPKEPKVRISVTLSVLQQAGTLLILARGKGKADVVVRAMQGDAELPVSRLLTHPRAFFLLDGAAAKDLVRGALDAMES